MKIVKTNLPKKSVFYSQNEFQFIDAYSTSFVDNNSKVNIQEIGKLFFSTGPKWIDSLFALRNKIVKFLGLKISNSISERDKLLENFICKKDEQIGLFKVFLSDENEVVLGEDDKHLDFRVSLLLRFNKDKKEKELVISTFVKFNNWFGKLYFILVKPFHSFIVPSMLKSIVENINKENNQF